MLNNSVLVFIQSGGFYLVLSLGTRVNSYSVQCSSRSGFVQASLPEAFLLSRFPRLPPNSHPECPEESTGVAVVHTTDVLQVALMYETDWRVYSLILRLSSASHLELKTVRKDIGDDE